MAESSAQQALEQQLQAAREEAELTLEQLHLVQEELEVYFLKAQDLEEQLKTAGDSAAERDAATKQVAALTKERDQHKVAADKATAEAKEAAKQRDAATKQVDALTKERDQHKVAADKAAAEAKEAAKQRDAATKARDKAVTERGELFAQAEQNGDLLKTAQRMLDGQARYLEDLSLKEEQAEQAVDELRLLKEEIRHYIQHSRPSSTLKPEQIQRLIELVKNPAVSTRH